MHNFHLLVDKRGSESYLETWSQDSLAWIVQVDGYDLLLY